ncbi:hypothetical protein EV356DRAFT_286327 [Viridothelium virens]|uniref:Uncharacterized protein n=1 Tax=Viridothelium virens TaxID=1048519 RepID=A0A6A6H0U8_VIRVR|nr:hypothetical protein EV356DRAFT_286327 [Viridothelium virens]
MRKEPTKVDQVRLGQKIWAWNLCEQCLHGRICEKFGCDGKRAKNLTRYWTFHANAVIDYMSMTGKCLARSFELHETIFRAMGVLQEQPSLAREEVAERAGVKPAEVDLAVRLMTMIPCSYETGCFIIMEQGTNPIFWGPTTRFDQFLEQALPTVDTPIKLSAQQASALMARKLRKKIDFRIRPTNDLREHLRLDRGRRAILVFHHTAFLKEHLRLSKVLPPNSSVQDCLRLGAIPRQLALEYLDSIHKILFPLADRTSRRMLNDHIRNHAFDHDIIKFESASFRNPEERDCGYSYLGKQLKELLDEVEHPLPRGRVGKFIQRNSDSRHMMLATLAGVAFAILLGFLSLIVSSVQAWIAWQQWKHPVNN